MATVHPHWTKNPLKGKRGIRKEYWNLKKKNNLKRWEKDIINGGTLIDKYATIDSWTYPIIVDHFMEARTECLQVKTCIFFVYFIVDSNALF